MPPAYLHTNPCPNYSFSDDSEKSHEELIYEAKKRKERKKQLAKRIISTRHRQNKVEHHYTNSLRK